MPNSEEGAPAAVSTDAPEPVRAGEVRQWMIDYITAVIEVPQDPFPAEARFDSYGLDSVELVIMSGMIEERFALQVEADEIFANPSVASLSRHLAARLAMG